MDQFLPAMPSSDDIMSLGSNDGENSDCSIIKTKKFKHKKIRKRTAEKGTERNFQELVVVHKEDYGIANDEKDKISFIYDKSPRESITSRQSDLVNTLRKKSMNVESLAQKLSRLIDMCMKPFIFAVCVIAILLYNIKSWLD